PRAESSLRLLAAWWSSCAPPQRRGRQCPPPAARPRWPVVAMRLRISTIIEVEILSELLPELLEGFFRRGNCLTMGNLVAHEAGVELGCELYAFAVGDGLGAKGKTDA